MITISMHGVKSAPLHNPVSRRLWCGLAQGMRFTRNVKGCETMGVRYGLNRVGMSLPYERHGASRW